ncbi:MAG: hypothetical protein QNJ72_36290 [Pleurocapsa sp. MO_226.B13]|nr:hypothetical protein [Pleurocapsa sp. MO_226.B13]
MLRLYGHWLLVIDRWTLVALLLPLFLVSRSFSFYPLPPGN